MYWKYLKYVIRHKWFVFIECCRFKKYWLGIMHDLSKFRPSEFIPYARYFYGNYPEYCGGSYSKYYQADIDRHFDVAWLNHIHRNKHHWQHWLLQKQDGNLKLIPIPPKYLVEMVADWNGAAGIAINGKKDTIDWYQKNKDNIKLNRINRKFVEGKLA